MPRSLVRTNAGAPPFFFFQAEDGIRDHCVTGVQTCALPISQGAADSLRLHGVCAGSEASRRLLERDEPHEGVSELCRSEERRVGKECRCRRTPCYDKKRATRSCGSRASSLIPSLATSVSSR